MTDIVKRLRGARHMDDSITLGGFVHDRVRLEAADEIERLRIEVKQLRVMNKKSREIGKGLLREYDKLKKRLKLDNNVIKMHTEKNEAADQSG